MKWIGVALVTQHVVNACQEDYGNAVLAIEGILDNSKRWNALVVKVSRRMCSDTFKKG